MRRARGAETPSPSFFAGAIAPCAAAACLALAGCTEIRALRSPVAGLGRVVVQAFVEAERFWRLDGPGGTNMVYPLCTVIDPVDGSRYSAGLYMGDLDMGPFHETAVGSFDVFVAKQTADGEYAWARSVGGSSADQVTQGTGDCLRFDGTNLYLGLITGSNDFAADGQTPPAIGFFDGVLLSYTMDGDLRYARRFGAAGTNYQIQSITTPANGVLYWAGLTTDDATFGPPGACAGGCLVYGAHDATDGDPLWIRRWGNSSTVGDTSTGYGISVGTNGDAFIIGVFSGTADADLGAPLVSTGGQDGYVLRVQRSDGTPIWARTISTDNGNSDFVGMVRIDAAGRPTILNFAPAMGNLTYEGLAGSIAMTKQTYIASWNVDGSGRWAKPLPIAQPTQLVSDQHGGFWISGLSEQAGVASLPFLWRTDDEGDFQAEYALPVVPGTILVGYSISAFPDGNLFVAGAYNGTIDFAGETYPSGGANRGFLLQIRR